MSTDPDRFEDRAVLVTGADGFIGSHLTDRLVQAGAEVHCFVRATSTGGLRNIRHLQDEVTVHPGDLRDPFSVRRAVRAISDRDDTFVFHLGAETHVWESWERPSETLETNVMGTLYVLQAVLEEDVDLTKLVTAGSSEEYGNMDPQRCDEYELVDGDLLLSEASPLNPTSIYASSKVCADFLTRNYHDAYGLPALTTRMFNNYGPRQNPRPFTGTVITQALERDVVEVGSLWPKRDMCYVADGVLGQLHVALEGEPGEVYCFGQGETVSMGDWLDLILAVGLKEGHWGERPEVVSTEERKRPGTTDVRELRADNTRIRDLTGWEPEHSWEDGLRETIRWYAENPSEWKGLVDWR